MKNPFEEFRRVDNKIKKQAHSLCVNMMKVVEAKDVEKTAYCWYNVIKHTYSLAEGQGVLEEDREEIETTLKGMQKTLNIMFMLYDWDIDEIKQFDDKIKELWVPGGDKC